MKLSVVIPIYNEASTLKEIIRRVEEIDILKEIIVIDDGSTDGSRECLDELKISGLRDPENNQLKVHVNSFSSNRVWFAENRNRFVSLHQ